MASCLLQSFDLASACSGWTRHSRRSSSIPLTTTAQAASPKSEFLASMAVMLHPSDMEEQVSMAFDAYDTNRNGRLEMDELHNVLSAMFSTMCKMGIRDEALEPSVESAAALYRHMDREEKGYVTKEDYLRLAKSNPEMLKRLGLGTRQGQRSGSRILRSSLHQQMNQMIKQRATGESGGLTPAKEPGASSGSTPKRNTISGTLYGVPPIITRRRGRGTGKTVTFGHDNWELVVQMMLAIRLSVGRAIKLAKEAARKSDDKGDVSTPKKGEQEEQHAYGRRARSLCGGGCVGAAVRRHVASSHKGDV